MNIQSAEFKKQKNLYLTNVEVDCIKNGCQENKTISILLIYYYINIL